jgi:hypothetical protein
MSACQGRMGVCGTCYFNAAAAADQLDITNKAAIARSHVPV